MKQKMRVGKTKALLEEGFRVRVPAGPRPRSDVVEYILGTSKVVRCRPFLLRRLRTSPPRSRNRWACRRIPAQHGATPKFSNAAVPNWRASKNAMPLTTRKRLRTRRCASIARNANDSHVNVANQRMEDMKTEIPATVSCTVCLILGLRSAEAEADKRVSVRTTTRTACGADSTARGSNELGECERQGLIPQGRSKGAGSCARPTRSGTQLFECRSNCWQLRSRTDAQTSHIVLV